MTTPVHRNKIGFYTKLIAINEKIIQRNFSNNTIATKIALDNNNNLIIIVHSRGSFAQSLQVTGPLSARISHMAINL